MQIIHSLLGFGRRRDFTALLGVCALAAPLALAGCDDDDDDDDGIQPDTQTFRIRVEHLGTAYPYVRAGTFEMAVGNAPPGPIGPGEAYEVRFTAGRDTSLSFATMFGESNDLFYAPDEDGIALYDEAGLPVSGDVTDQVELWDLGTEIDQEPGLGPDQAPRQGEANTGLGDAIPVVHRAINTFGNLPPVEAVLRVTLTAEANQEFVLRIENVSTNTTLTTSAGTTLPVPLSPGVYVVHTGPNPLFTLGERDVDLGLEQLAEDGNPEPLAVSVQERTGVTQLVSPGLLVLHPENITLFDPGVEQRGEGLEALAEDGNPEELADSLSALLDPDNVIVFDTPLEAGMPRPLRPGESFEFTFEANRTQVMSMAMMLGQSNDAFIATEPAGVDLFPGGEAISGDITNQFGLWDLGTEVNQEPGIGNDQAPRQLTSGAGAAEQEPIELLLQREDGFDYPTVPELIRVTIEPVEP